MEALIQIIQETDDQSYVIDGSHDIQDWIKVHIFWEDHIIWKNLPNLFDITW